MKSTTIRELKRDMTSVLSWVARGESVEVRHRGEPVALLSPAKAKSRVVRPDFAARLKAIYGTKKLATTATDLVTEARGDRCSAMRYLAGRRSGRIGAGGVPDV